MNRSTLFLIALLSACTPQSRTAADAAGTALSHVLGWCDRQGVDTAPAYAQLAEGKTELALLTAQNIVEHLRAQGKAVPADVGALLALLVELDKAGALP